MSRFPSPSKIAAAACAACLLAAFTDPASAKLAVCNKTEHPASVALGYFDGAHWASSGWWTVAPGDCTALISEPLAARYYYLYAEHHDVGGAWDGDRSFCVGRGRFTAEGRADCLAHGYEARRFFQVDTGDSRDWTENLAD